MSRNGVMWAPPCKVIIRQHYSNSYVYYPSRLRCKKSASISRFGKVDRLLWKCQARFNASAHQLSVTATELDNPAGSPRDIRCLSIVVFSRLPECSRFQFMVTAPWWFGLACRSASVRSEDGNRMFRCEASGVTLKPANGGQGKPGQ